jgi:hypothetical protein
LSFRARFTQEQHASGLGVAVALPELVRSYGLGVPHTSSCPERQEHAFGHTRPLHGSARPGAVAGADGSLEDVPQVVEPSMGMPGVHVLHIGKPDASFVDKDEWIDLFVRGRPGR